MKEHFRILGIAETKDLDQIKTAYREKLISVNPEDDPEGFKQLRGAYEQAVRYAETEAIEPEPDTTELGQWLTRLEQIYNNFSERISSEVWKQLLSEDVCQALDTWNEARERTLGFLMEHFRLPYEVWCLLDKQFRLIEDEKELREIFHPNFMDYVINSCRQPSILEYNLFEGPNDADYDQYIRLYYELKSQVDEGREYPTELEQQIEPLGIYYPYLEVEKARSFLQKDDPQKAWQIIEPLTIKYPSNDYITYYQAQIYWKLEQYEQAKACYDQLLADNPDHFSAKIGIAEYLERQNEFKEAKEIYLQLLEIDPLNQTAHQGMQRVNEDLIKHYRDELEKHPGQQETTLELCWCLFQNEQFNETISLLDQMDPEPDSEFDYHNIKGRAFLRGERYQEALPHISFWLDRLKEIDDLADAEMRKRKRRLGYAYYAKADCYIHMDENPDEDRQRQIIELIDLAIKAETSPEARYSYLHGKAHTLLKWQRYQDCVDVSSQIIEENKGYFPAYIIRQEAYYSLRHYQNVIDDYYHATEIFEDYLPPYLFAAKTFWEVNECEAGLKVVERAEERKLASDELSFCKARFLRTMAESEKDSTAAYELCAEVVERMTLAESDIKDQAEVYGECAKCLMDIREFLKASEMIDKALDLKPEEQNYLYTKANIYFRTNKFKQALDIYQGIDRQLPDNPIVINRIAETYERMGQRDQALEHFHKVLEINDRHPTANHSLMGLYQMTWEDTEKKEYYELAKRHAGQQLEICPEAYYYIERGLLYTDGDEYQLAIADFLQALTYHTHDVYSYSNLGVVYFHLRDYQKSIEMANQAAEIMDGAVTTLPYRTLGKCYQALNDYQQALKCFQENMKLFPHTASVYRDLGHCYRNMKEYNAALKIYETGMKQEFTNKSQFLRYQATVYRNMGKERAALKIYQNLLRENKSDLEAREELADFLFYTQKKYSAAVKEYLELLNKVNPDDIHGKYGSCCVELGACYYYLNRKQEAKEYLEKALRFYQRGNGSFEEYLENGGYAARLYHLILIYYYLEDHQTVRFYYDKMKAAKLCSYCEYNDCYELYLAEGLISQQEDRAADAIENYQKACEISGNEQVCQFLLENMTKKKWRFRLW